MADGFRQDVFVASLDNGQQWRCPVTFVPPVEQRWLFEIDRDASTAEEWRFVACTVNGERHAVSGSIPVEGGGSPTLQEFVAASKPWVRARKQTEHYNPLAGSHEGVTRSPPAPAPPSSA